MANNPPRFCTLITGAASGIGAGMAERLLAAGHRVILTDRDALAVQATAARLGEGAYAIALDVTNAESITQLQSELVALALQPNVLINNAGLQHVAAFQDFPMPRFSYLLDVMLTGAASITQALLPQMRAQNFGRIVNIGSIHALVASRYKSAYVAAKHGLLGFSKVLALEAAEQDITINTICPAYVRTPLVDQQIAAQASEHGISADSVVRDIMLKPMPKGVFISMDELSGICEFLISPVARNITGQCIVVDGGWTAQ